ncbi:MAG: ACP S-malonyltransferase [Spirochaetaceae bacterium]|jgi:[acyl-carrier-protein] S-malonyltransferase|nr:ACP S-malonyltransferase [Spirochaetaceae bacterium]
MVIPKKAAFLFPGQGSQYPGMALDLHERSAGVRDLFAIAASVLGRDMRKLLAESDEAALKQTEVAQCAVTLANLASAAFLAENGVRAALCSGHSLGEYAALREAGVISTEDCFALVRERGRAMAGAAAQDAGAPPEAGMAAVLGLDGGEVERLIEQWREAGLPGLFAANFNAARQTVISGTREALREAEIRFKEAGARRVLPLKVSGPFHSPLMADAAERFSGFLATVNFQNPAIPFFSNVTGGIVQTGAEAKELALRQITAPVRWTAVQAALAALEPDALFEAGPGRVLQGLWADTGASAPCYAAGKAADIDTFLQKSALP